MTKRDAARPSAPPEPTWAQRGWSRFCRLISRVFYRRFEAVGREHIPRQGPVIFCANHVNALVDAVVVQASCPRPIHPLARSGLFRSLLFRPVLRLIQAIPVYRRRRGPDGTPIPTAGSNEDSFRRCYDYLGENRTLLIFPEGQSHSDPKLRALKTGAARLALGARDANGELPALVPVGLTFTHKGRFRANVLVQYGPPIRFEALPEEENDRAVRRLTAAIGGGLEAVTLNVDSWEDLSLMKLLQEFFTLRSSRGGNRVSLGERFRSLQQIVEAHRRLRYEEPGRVQLLREKLRRFARLCRRYGVRDYQLELRYRPLVVARFVARILLFGLFVFPLAAWGVLGSVLPYAATRLASHFSARGRDQYDTAGMLFGLGFFALFWSLQTFGVFQHFGPVWAVLYATSLPLTGLVALAVGKERQRILENVRVFFLFTRKGEIREYLRIKREELEIEVARFARQARHLSEGDLESLVVPPSASLPR